MASSMAESPPPTTAIVSPLKKNPSQVAQVDTPWPMRRISFSSPSIMALAPVDTITARAWILHVADLDQEGAGREVDPGHLLGEELGAETGRLGPEVGHQLGAHGCRR